MDEVTISNMALSNCGSSDVIESLNEKSTAAEQCLLWYDFARRQALEAHNWSFARKRDTLALHSDPAPSGWYYRYAVPADYIKARLIENPGGFDLDAIPFDAESALTVNEQTILTDQPEAILVYTFDQAAVVRFSPLFVVTLSYLLAHYVAYPVTGNKSTKQQMLEAYSGLLRSAAGSNAQEGVARQPRDGEGIRARL
jgi:hypothetical protein